MNKVCNIAICSALWMLAILAIIYWGDSNSQSISSNGNLLNISYDKPEQTTCGAPFGVVTTYSFNEKWLKNLPEAERRKYDKVSAAPVPEPAMMYTGVRTGRYVKALQLSASPQILKRGETITSRTLFMIPC